MDKQVSIEQVAQDTTKFAKTVIRNKIFDIVGVGLIIAMLALHLGVLELRDLTLENLIIILLECIPFFIVAILLSSNYYSKGAATGKQTEAYKSAIAAYSEKVESFTGEHIDALPDFCEEYNDKVLRKLQEAALKRAAISYDRFNNETLSDTGEKLVPLKVLSAEQLSAQAFTEEQIRCITKAKKIRIKGLNENSLLGTFDDVDTTNLGSTEKELRIRRTKSYAISYAIITLLLSIMGIRDILQWGWSGLLLVVFKIVIVFCTALMNNFKGYDDITIDLVNHIIRKTDVLKLFEYWFDNHKKSVTNDNNTDG